MGRKSDAPDLKELLPPSFRRGSAGAVLLSARCLAADALPAPCHRTAGKRWRRWRRSLCSHWPQRLRPRCRLCCRAPPPWPPTLRAWRPRRQRAWRCACLVPRRWQAAWRAWQAWVWPRRWLGRQGARRLRWRRGGAWRSCRRPAGRSWRWMRRWARGCSKPWAAVSPVLCPVMCPRCVGREWGVLLPCPALFRRGPLPPPPLPLRSAVQRPPPQVGATTLAQRPPPQVGAIAHESLPAAGVDYATGGSRRELLRFFRRDGCHHCGTRRGYDVIGDHMPPNKHVKELQATARRLPLRLPGARPLARAVGLPTGPPRQRYYPQCRACSQRQAGAIRNDKRVLIWHEVRGGKGTRPAACTAPRRATLSTMCATFPLAAGAAPWRPLYRLALGRHHHGAAPLWLCRRQRQLRQQQQRRQAAPRRFTHIVRRPCSSAAAHFFQFAAVYIHVYIPLLDNTAPGFHCTVIANLFCSAGAHCVDPSAEQAGVCCLLHCRNLILLQN